ncbi:MAG TPA: VOC family protein [Gemmatimonadaceae bacterium]|nr:VOC family protein [Gemmatimonadaceae bacterium]
MSLVTLGVADLRRARRFYEQGLGWKPGFASDDVVFYETGGPIIALWSRRDLAAEAQIDDDESTFGGIALAHNVRARDDVDAVLAEAAAAGAAILKSAEDTVWGGYSGYFADLDGHLWEVAWNPAWRIAENGSVKLT